jgi:protein-L-isoaspartate(D-aspartate) O-methyltransferase
VPADRAVTVADPDRHHHPRPRPPAAARDRRVRRIRAKHPAPVDDPTTIPGRWVDWSIHDPQPSWIAIGWRDHDDPQHTGARTTLARLLDPGHHESYPHLPLDWRSLTAYLAAIGEPQLSAVARHGNDRGIGHTDTGSAAILLYDGTFITDRPHSPSLRTLRTCLDRWETTAGPAPTPTPPA